MLSASLRTNFGKLWRTIKNESIVQIQTLSLSRKCLMSEFSKRLSSGVNHSFVIYKQSRPSFGSIVSLDRGRNRNQRYRHDFVSVPFIERQFIVPDVICSYFYLSFPYWPAIAYSSILLHHIRAAYHVLTCISFPFKKTLEGMKK